MARTSSWYAPPGSGKLDLMKLKDLRDSGGCPLCVGGERSFTFSGASIGVYEVLDGGAEEIEAEFDEFGWPKSETSRCKKCGALWHFEFAWTDRPPLFLSGQVVEQEKE